MKKYFVFSDVHGNYGPLEEELIKNGFDFDNDEHFIISLGDNYDRGKQNIEMYYFLFSMFEKNRAILIGGNHEDIFKKIILKKQFNQCDIKNGTVSTAYDVLRSLCNKDIDYKLFYIEFEKYAAQIQNTKFFDLILKMQNYYETDRYIFLHGYIPVRKIKDSYYYLKDWRNSSQEEFDRSKWNNGQNMYEEHHICEPNKIIVLGHIPTIFNNYKEKYGISLTYDDVKKLSDNDIVSNSKIYEKKEIIALDAYTIKSGKVNILVIDECDM